MASDKFPVTKRTDVLPETLPAFKKKTGQDSFDKAMNAPNTPRPASSKRPDCPTDSQGFFDREEESYNITYQYCEDEPDNDSDD